MSRIDAKRHLETSRGTLDYTTIDLLKQIEEQPVIWNRRHEDYKKREAIDAAWEYITRFMVPFYDDIDEEEKLSLTNAFKARWANCVQGLMKSASLKRKNDRLFRPFTYAREMKFYLETKGIKFSDIYDSENVDGIEKPKIKEEYPAEDQSTENEVEVEEEEEEEDAVVDLPKTKKAKTSNTSVTFRSARLREKQTVLENNSPEKKIIITPKNNKQKQNKRTPDSVNGSVCYTLDTVSNSSNDVIEAAEENNEEVVAEVLYNSTPQPKRARTGVTVNPSASYINNNPQTFTSEADAADQAFFDSIKPALRKMNDTQKLDFQIDILQILKSFRTN